MLGTESLIGSLRQKTPRDNRRIKRIRRGELNDNQSHHNQSCEFDASVTPHCLDGRILFDPHLQQKLNEFVIAVAAAEF